MIKTPSEDAVDGLPPASTSGCSLKRQVTLGAEAPEMFTNGTVLPNKKKIKPTIARQKSRRGAGAMYIPSKDYWPVNLVSAVFQYIYLLPCSLSHRPSPTLSVMFAV